MIAIHHRKNSFSEQWIEYCESNKVAYKNVNCFSGNIIHDVEDCTALMWHWHHNDYKSTIFARQLTLSLELSGTKVFPDTNTAWHFDDKLGQKYLFDATGIPAIETHVFFDKSEALLWAERTSYPKVFKLRVGAGSEQVRLVNGLRDAKAMINKAFSGGFAKRNRKNLLSERVWHFRRDKTLKSFFNISRGVARLLIPTKIEQDFPPEKNYVYFQDFIPDNDHDIRVIVIGHRAFAIKRLVRGNDFRASGSGKIIHDPDQIPHKCLTMAFEAVNALKTQCLALDFVFIGKSPLVVELSYAFSVRGYQDCPGYWDQDLNWFEGKFIPEHFMIEDILQDSK